MVPRLLARFDPFFRLDYSALTTLAQHCRMLALPAGRLLVRPGQPIRGNYYLARGRIRIHAGSGRAGTARGEDVAAGAPRSRLPLLSAGQLAIKVQTLTPARVLWVDLDGVGYLLGTDGTGGYQVEELEGLAGGDWLRVFLGGVIGRSLSLGEVAELLKSARPVPVRCGERVIRAGDPGAGLYLIEAGAAQVSRDGRVLAQLPAGSFFGEEALLSRQRRNADVDMIGDGRLLHVAVETFDALVLPAVLTAGDRSRRTPEPDAGRRPIDLDREPWHSADLRQAARQLDPSQRYRVTGATPAARRHAAFLLAAAGLDVDVAPALDAAHRASSGP